MSRLHNLLYAKEAIRDGHFELTSGKHSPTYVEKYALISEPTILEELCGRIIRAFGTKFDYVAGPLTGGALVAYECARQMRARVIVIDGDRARNIYSVPPSSRTLLVDDVFTTGGTIERSLHVLGHLGADVKHVGVLVNRSDRAVGELNVTSAVALPLNTYTPEDCPLCALSIGFTRR